MQGYMNCYEKCVTAASLLTSLLYLHKSDINNYVLEVDCLLAAVSRHLTANGHDINV